MAFEIPTIPYSGQVKEICLGAGEKAVTVGGDTAYPFYRFEGDFPNAPKIAMEVYDFEPEDWPEEAIKPFKEVASDPVAWAKKCIDEYGAEIIALQLKSTDPNGLNRSAEDAVEVVKKVADAIDVPLIVWGCANPEKDEEVLKLVAEACEGKSLTIGPVAEGNYKKVGAQAIAYKQTVISSTSIDINLAKQLNVLMENLGVSPEKTIIDPTTGALGYGIEYTYSVMERIRMAALTQQDEKLQLPMICNIGPEVWKIKEASIEDETMGDTAKRGILIEAVTATMLMAAGGNILIMRHPESVNLVRELIGDLMKQ